jgi:hypothetical protein
MRPPGGQRSEKNRRWSVKGSVGRAVKRVWQAVLPRDQQADGTAVGLAPGRFPGRSDQQETEGLGGLFSPGHSAASLPDRGQPRTVPASPMAEGQVQGPRPGEGTIPQGLLVQDPGAPQPAGLAGQLLECEGVSEPCPTRRPDCAPAAMSLHPIAGQLRRGRANHVVPQWASIFPFGTARCQRSEQGGVMRGLRARRETRLTTRQSSPPAAHGRRIRSVMTGRSCGNPW